MSIAELLVTALQLCSPDYLIPSMPRRRARGLRAPQPLPTLLNCQTLSSCCRTWLLPCAVRRGLKEVGRLRRSSPQLCPRICRSAHPQPTPAALGQSGAGVPAAPAGLALPALHRGPLLLAGHSCGSELSSLHACGFVSIPHGAAGAVLASPPCLWFQQRAAQHQCKSFCGFDDT